MDGSFSWTTAAIIFFTYVVIDVMYAMYVLSVSKRHPIAASFYGSAIYTLSAYGVITYSKNPMYIVFLATGAFLGTYLVVKYKKD